MNIITKFSKFNEIKTSSISYTGLDFKLNKIQGLQTFSTKRNIKFLQQIIIGTPKMTTQNLKCSLVFAVKKGMLSQLISATTLMLEILSHRTCMT